MFGSNYFGAPTFGQGSVGETITLLQVINAITRAVSGFSRYTRRLN